MLTDDQRMTMIYTGISMDFNTERTLGWSRSQMLTLVNLAGISLLTTALAIELTYMIEFFGMGFFAFWYQANRRTQRRIKYWEDCLAKTEPSQAELGVFRVFTGSEWNKVNKPPLLYAVNALPLIFLVVWISALSFTFLK